jgi:DNA polymerase-1
MAKVALIDADIILYEWASICEKSIPWPFTDEDEEPGILWTRHAHLDEAWARTVTSFETLTSRVGADSFVAVVTKSSENWRYSVYPAYKSNRKAGVKPMLVNVLRDMIAAEPWGRMMPPLEGDDVLGILQTKPGAGDTIIISTDKDMQTIPGMHYNPGKDLMFEVSHGEANSYHLRQALTGDPTDGYPGCTGIGAKTVLGLVPDTVEYDEILPLWNDVIVPAFVKKGLTEEFALSQARVARICRAEDFNPKTKEVILWNPT